MKCATKALVMALLAVSVTVVQTSQSQARKGRHAVGIAAGVVGLGLLGIAAEAEARRRGVPTYYGGYGHRCYPGPVECEYFERRCFYNEYGDEICPPPVRRCYRHEVCD